VVAGKREFPDGHHMNPFEYDKPFTKGDAHAALREAETAALIAAQVIYYERSDPDRKRGIRIGYAVWIIAFPAWVMASMLLGDGGDLFSWIACPLMVLFGLGMCLPPTAKEWDAWNAKHCGGGADRWEVPYTNL
jgi:hypothetical protein